jgi:hypothetical protein
MTQPKRTRIGRPPVDPAHRTIPATFAIPRAEFDELRQRAEATGVSASAIVAGLVRGWLQRQRRR